nr:hypothetical protein CFP56_33617 [Quercus suber]
MAKKAANDKVTTVRRSKPVKHRAPSTKGEIKTENEKKQRTRRDYDTDQRKEEESRKGRDLKLPYLSRAICFGPVSPRFQPLVGGPRQFALSSSLALVAFLARRASMELTMRNPMQNEVPELGIWNRVEKNDDNANETR